LRFACADLSREEGVEQLGGFVLSARQRVQEIRASAIQPR
jgi:hypothetical protein